MLNLRVFNFWLFSKLFCLLLDYGMNSYLLFDFILSSGFFEVLIPLSLAFEKLFAFFSLSNLLTAFLFFWFRYMLDSVFGVSISKKWLFWVAKWLNCSFKSWAAKWFGELYLFEFKAKVYLSGRINPEIFNRWS